MGTWPSWVSPALLRSLLGIWYQLHVGKVYPADSLDLLHNSFIGLFVYWFQDQSYLPATWYIFDAELQQNSSRLSVAIFTQETASGKHPHTWCQPYQYRSVDSHRPLNSKEGSQPHGYAPYRGVSMWPFVVHPSRPRHIPARHMELVSPIFAPYTLRMRSRNYASLTPCDKSHELPIHDQLAIRQLSPKSTGMKQVASPWVGIAKVMIHDCWFDNTPLSLVERSNGITIF
jgi:hypothetical protein